jgi:hypothetical protein
LKSPDPGHRFAVRDLSRRRLALRVVGVVAIAASARRRGSLAVALSSS